MGPSHNNLTLPFLGSCFASCFFAFVVAVVGVATYPPDN